MCAALAKDIQKKFGGAIGDLVWFGEVGSAVHQHRQLDDALHPVKVAKGGLQIGEEVYGDAACGLLALRSCDLLPDFAGERLAVFLAMRPDK